MFDILDNLGYLIQNSISDRIYNSTHSLVTSKLKLPSDEHLRIELTHEDLDIIFSFIKKKKRIKKYHKSVLKELQS